MKKITFIFLAVMSVFSGLQAQDIRKLSIDSDIINLDAGETYKITPNTAGASYEIFKGVTSQGIFPYTKAINTIVGLKLNRATLTLGFEEPFILVSTIVPDQTVTYTSSDATVATVSSTGLVTGKTAGTATITATAGEQTAVCEVTVKTLAERIADAAGTTATIIVYGNEEIPATISINTDNSIITLTTADNTERILKKTGVGNLLNIGAASVSAKVILDGYVNVKGLATMEYGGTDEENNTASLINVAAGSELTLKGHAKVSGNAYVLSNPAGVNILGGGITAYGRLVVDEDAQISNNIVCCTKPYPTPWSADSRNGHATWGGAVYVTGSGVMEIRGNAKISGNKSINKGGNAIGGAIFPEGSTVYMYGGEISGNSTEASHRASSGAVQLTSGRLIMVGGIIKDNTLKFGGAGTGVACYANADKLFISGSASIPAISGERVSILADYTTITGITIRQDVGNTVHLDANCRARVAGIPAGTAPVVTFDIKKTTTTRALGKYDPDTYALSDFTIEDPAPVDKFELGSYIITPSNYATFSLETVTDKEIKPDGTVGAK